MASRSDFRLYNSDGNATIQGFSSPTAFRSQCNTLFSRLVDTVPKSVELSDPVKPYTWKADNIKFDLSADGVVSISGQIRYLYGSGSPAPIVKYQYWTEDRKQTMPNTTAQLLCEFPIKKA
jgi:hypothetical protein